MKTLGSLFSGIGGFDLGLERAGFNARWQIENDKFCNKTLERHWPEVTRYGDITTVDPHGLERVDLIAFGFPCQDLSVAGKGEGLAGERSQLFWEAIRLIAVLEPSWLLIENVPGLFSSNAGGDFGEVINALDELRYGVAWRVLDSQYFGVPQRRRRVYIVGHLGKPCPPEILFDAASMSRDIETYREKAQEVAYPLRARAGRNGSPERADETFVVRLAQTSSNGWGVDSGRVHTLDGTGGDAVAAPFEEWAQNGGAMSALVYTPLDTDREHEATGLSGLVDPDEPDGPRYRALGNAVTVNVAEWIGKRIMKAMESL